MGLRTCLFESNLYNRETKKRSLIILCRHHIVSEQGQLYREWLSTISSLIYSQREGMGLLEYQVMPSLHDVAHDGWLCSVYICYITMLEIPSARSWASTQPVRYGKGRQYGPFIMYKISPPGHSPPASQARRRVGPAL
jgi:hypothetical protein